MEYESQWQQLWSDACEAYAKEAGDLPEDLEPWQANTLQRFALSRLERPLSRGLKRQSQQATANESLTSFKDRLQRIVITSFQQNDAETAFERATLYECSGKWEEAREAYSEALLLGPSQPLQFSLRFAQLLHVMATSGSGEDGASEQILRHAISTAGQLTTRKRALLARLILLLLQQGRNEEAIPLLVDGGWKYRLASWILCPDENQNGLEKDGFPGCVYDNAIPEGFMQHLQNLLSPASEFWTEHGYNEILGSGEVGYFSYVQDVEGEAQNTLDLIIRHVWEVLKKTSLFPGLEDAKVAEWWAHKRPHACGHQMHYDSDNEGIGGVRNPICSCIIYVIAPPGVGGPTLVTNQKLSKAQLGNKGWLVTPRQGRLAAYDGTYFHGVVPGCGKAPPVSVEPEFQRRVTFMIAFWKEIRTRPFGPDGLPGSSRPLPRSVSEFGPKRYTWHQRLALPLDAGGYPSPTSVFPVSGMPIWTEIQGGDVPEGVGLPSIQECFQF